MIHINHLSLTVKNPEVAARALAEMTNGTPRRPYRMFRTYFLMQFSKIKNPNDIFKQQRIFND